MDIQKIAHIGTESVLFIGMFVYFSNQIKKLKNENEELKTKLNTIHENTNKQLNNVYMVLDSVKNTMTSIPIQREFRQSPTRVLNSQRGMSLNNNQSNIKQRKNSDVTEVQSKSRKQVPIEVVDDEQDLDAELDSELQELEEEEESEELSSKDMDDSYNKGKKK